METRRRRERYVEEHRPERTRGKQLRGVMADRRISKGQGHEHLCDTSMPVRQGNLGNDRTATITNTPTGYEK